MNNPVAKCALVLITVGVFSCSTTEPRLLNLGRPEITDASEQNTNSSSDSDSRENSSSDSDNKTSAVGPKPHYYFYSFVRSNPSDPQGMQQFGVNQTEKVNSAIQDLETLKYSIDTELNPLRTRVMDVRGKLEEYSSQLSNSDTFVMYSHSHGVLPGLGIDWEANDRNKVSYKWEYFAEAIVNLPARNVVIFTMSCHSGLLAQALMKISDRWQGRRKSNGRNLVVLTAVSAEQIAKPTDRDTTEYGIGNAFTFAVRNALAGSADGFLDGIKDGKTTMHELVKYVLATAKEKSLNQESEPQFAGEYSERDVFL